MNAHTPGPWRADQVYVETDLYLVADCNSEDMPKPMAEANTHLIAASPNMLKVLKEIVFRANLCPEINGLKMGPSSYCRG